MERLQTRVISIFSPVGGVGKTTLALNLCVLLSNQDYRTLYLNLEELCSMYPLFQREDADPFSRLIYSIYAHPEQQIFTLDQAVCYDAR
ncbi:AAA family ATPase [Bacillus horti]|uniref:Cellulose biosynthesis protein BcsQ n=1 Tax=Caldalkalibacillus horti TaxID=77523 RepID=A0ABT9W4K2_9BACI|nr:AAA family ATPase [Bacillus horti]MDQ0168002.1 cellulose biosynthesis protein BcsQ [Bacillus horti]